MNSVTSLNAYFTAAQAMVFNGGDRFNKKT